MRRFAAVRADRGTPVGGTPVVGAKYELLVDGRRRWKADGEDDVRAWLAEYRVEHEQDDPDAAHVQVRKLSSWSWLTGGTMVDREAFLA
jgi:hypothetical protein